MIKPFRTIGAILILMLTALLPCKAQNNLFNIDDSCYVIYRQADSLLDSPSAPNLIAKLKSQAEKVNDDKAYTLAYTLALRNAVRNGNETEILVRYGELKEIARKTSYMQYYFYAYQLVSVYYFNQGQRTKSLEYSIKMHEEAVAMNNDYGKWFSSKYLSDLYLAGYKRTSARNALLEVVDIYNSTKDSTIRAQSMSKSYVNLAFLSGYGTQQYLDYVELALQTSKLAADTLLVDYALACRAAVLKDNENYKILRDKCRKNTLFPRVRLTGPQVLDFTDKALAGEWAYIDEQLGKLSRLEDFLYISDLAVSYDLMWLVSDCYDAIVQRLAESYEDRLNQALMETEVMLENEILNKQIIDHKNKAFKLMLVLVVLIVVLLVIVGIGSVLYVKKLNKAKKDAELSSRMKTQFVQNMSHEVRNPLNAVVGFSQLIAYAGDTLSEEEKQEYISYITNNSSMLMMLIDDILDLSDIDNGNYKLYITECNCNEICRMAFKTVEHRIPFGVKSSFVSDVPDDLTIHSDEKRVQQIIINFLTNACKNTTDGEITLRCTTSIKDNYVTFAVQDTGSGVPLEQAEAIFNRFSKLDSKKQGSGLGLNICKMLSEKLGGIVELDKSYGRAANASYRGARFYFHLP